MLVKRVFDGLIKGIGYFITQSAPVVAAFPAAVSILEASNYSLASWFIVGGVEFVGYTFGHMALPMQRRGWITTRQLVKCLIVYGIAIEGLIIGYDVAPAVHEWWFGGGEFIHATQASVALIFPMFTIGGAVLFSLTHLLREAEQDEEIVKVRSVRIEDRKADIDLEVYERKALQDVEQEREDRESKRRVAEQKALAPKEDKKKKVDSVGDSVSDSTADSGIDYERVIIDYYAKNPKASQREAQKATGVSQPKISKTLGKLESAGIIHRNGNGVEILADPESPIA